MENARLDPVYQNRSVCFASLHRIVFWLHVSCYVPSVDVARSFMRDKGVLTPPGIQRPSMIGPSGGTTLGRLIDVGWWMRRVSLMTAARYGRFIEE